MMVHLSFLTRLKRAIKNQRGVQNLITSSLAIIFAFVMIAITISVWSALMTKWRLDQSIDQIARQIELAGACDDDTAEMKEFLLQSIKCDNVKVTIDSAFETVGDNDHCIQLGVPFSVEAVIQTHIGIFGDAISYPITFTSRAPGVSEKYWKELS